MSYTSSVTSSHQPVLGSHKSSSRSSCSSCNSQLCSSYLVGLLACLLVVGGIFLAFHRWDYMWLAVSGVGVLLIFVGASLHYCGGNGNEGRQSQSANGDNSARTQQQTRSKRGANNHRIVSDQGSQNERLLPTAPPTSTANNGQNFSVSQLSLNMLPPFFPSFDTVSLGTQVTSSPNSASPVSPIMHLNGQSFLLLPIGGTATETSAEANSLARRLSTHLAVLEQQSFAQKRCFDSSNFGLGSMADTSSMFNFLTISEPKSTSQDEHNLQAAVPYDKIDAGMQTNQGNVITGQNDTANNASSMTSELEEPIYQVPRSLSTQVENDVQQSGEAEINISTTTPENTGQNELDQNPSEINDINTVPSTERTHLSSSTLESEEQEPTVLENDVNPSTSVEDIEGSNDHQGLQTVNAGEVLEIIVENNISEPEDNIQGEISQLDSLQITEGSSSISIPDPEWALPPSYEEVAPPSFKRLGHLKFAYETL